ncbi:MAG: hypothetical protein JSS51_12680 [Planctomycetes bacterium]|nr:hypothetical protein [Planctomycetota bacterium]
MTDTIDETTTDQEQTEQTEAAETEATDQNEAPTEHVDKGTGEVTQGLDAVDWQAIRVAREKVRKAQTLEMERRELHKAAKEALSAAQDELTAAIDAAANDSPAGTIFEAAAEQSSDPAGDSEAYKAVPVTELSLPGRVLKALDKAEIKTIGDLQEVQTEQGQFTSLPGIGEESATLIESALDAFWTEHPAGRAACKPGAKTTAGDDDQDDDEATTGSETGA